MAAVIFVLSIIMFAGAFVAMVHAKHQGDPDAGTALVAYPSIVMFAMGLFAYAYLYVWHDGLSSYDVETLYAVAGLFVIANLFTILRFAFVGQPRTKY